MHTALVILLLAVGLGAAVEHGECRTPLGKLGFPPCNWPVLAYNSLYNGCYGL